MVMDWWQCQAAPKAGAQLDAVIKRLTLLPNDRLGRHALRSAPVPGRSNAAEEAVRQG